MRHHICRALGVAVWTLTLMVRVACASDAKPLRLSPNDGVTILEAPDADASDGEATVVVSIPEGGGSGTILSHETATVLPAGAYRLALDVSVYRPDARQDPSIMGVSLRLMDADRALGTWPFDWCQTNGKSGCMTTLERDFILTAPARPSLQIAWTPRELTPDERKAFIARRQTAPKTPPPGQAVMSNDADESVADLPDGGEPVSLTSLREPSILVRNVRIVTVAADAFIESVLPAKVLVAPGEENPVRVRVRNGASVLDATVELECRAGLDLRTPAGVQAIQVAPGRTAEVTFPWKAGDSRFGHAMRARLSRNGTTLHESEEVFSVNDSVWNVAIQGGGFTSWYGREEELARHVEANRRHYVNVEEAFSWQPSSWTDLTPDSADWWAGQNNFHNSRTGLETWLRLSHAHGIRMITYIWPTASGPDGFRDAQRDPDPITRTSSGALSSEFFDVEDLRLGALLHGEPALWRYQYGVWHALGINLGRLKAIDWAANEVIASAKMFGWDGVRFDNPPSWSAMGAGLTWYEAGELGVTDMLARLIPEWASQRTGTYDELAISTRNLRYFRKRVADGIGPQFLISHNHDPVTVADGRPNSAWMIECARDGQQIMDESIRKYVTTWTGYQARIIEPVRALRAVGGHQTVVALDEAPCPLAVAYAAIFTFAGGSHPYLDYGWSLPLPGAYTRFATRYGQFLWDMHLKAATPEATGIAVESEATLLWKPYLNTLEDTHQSYTILHLITPPTTDTIRPSAPTAIPPWPVAPVVTVATAEQPVAWVLSAEPDVRVAQVPVTGAPGAWRLAVDGHRLWSVVVLVRAKGGQ